MHLPEDGTANPDANSYASLAEADAYHAAHLYASVWTVATAETKEKALQMATRLIDGQYQFHGYRSTTTQALQWPRQLCPDPDQRQASWGLLTTTAYVPANTIPQALVQATCELARELLIADRTAAPAGEGLNMQHTSHYQRDSVGVTTSDSTTTQYNKLDTKPIISPVAQALLSKYGVLQSARTAQVRLIRV